MILEPTGLDNLSSSYLDSSSTLTSSEFIVSITFFMPREKSIFEVSVYYLTNLAFIGYFLTKSLMSLSRTLGVFSFDKGLNLPSINLSARAFSRFGCFKTFLNGIGCVRCDYLPTD